jgi:hypothetical protein
MARERLSSAQTFFLKVVFPPLWIAAFGAGTVLVFLASGRPGSPGHPPPPDWLKWLFLGILVGAGSLIAWGCGRLKQVEMDDRNLYLSNFRREIAVPLREVEDVRQLRWRKGQEVRIELRSDTDFGSTLVFLPKVRFLLFWREHPVVEQIRQAVRAAQRSGGHPVR